MKPEMLHGARLARELIAALAPFQDPDVPPCHWARSSWRPAMSEFTSAAVTLAPSSLHAPPGR